MTNNHPLVLIYKRTHRGDPDSNGIFGIHDCMGSVRNRKYDAVIGIGGKQPWQGDEDIALRINWIGIDPIKQTSNSRGPLVSFSKYCLYDGNGPFITEIAPKLYKHMFIDANRRSVMSSSLPSDIYVEIQDILKLANKCPPTRGLSKRTKVRRKCSKTVRRCK